MLYKPGDLTLEQAEKIIGEKMMNRINMINEWAKQNDYIFLLHSTFSDSIPGIFNEGLRYPTFITEDTREELLENSTVTEKELDMLDDFTRIHGMGQLAKVYDTYLPPISDTVSWRSTLTAKELLEYNHRGANITVLFCVPRKTVENIGKRAPNNGMETPEGFINHSRLDIKRNDPYLKRTILCRKTEEGKLEYQSRYYYLPKGVLFAFNRDKITIKYNKEYDETCYIDGNCSQRGLVSKDDLKIALRKVEDINKRL